MYTIRPPTAHHELAIITWSQVTQSREWMERPENSSKGQSDVCPLRTQLQGQSWKLKFQSLLSVKSILGAISWRFLRQRYAMWYVMSKYSWRFWFLWFFLCIMHPYSMCPCVSYKILAVPDTHTQKKLTENSCKKASANIQILANMGGVLRRIN